MKEYYVTINYRRNGEESTFLSEKVADNAREAEEKALNLLGSLGYGKEAIISINAERIG